MSDWERFYWKAWGVTVVLLVLVAAILYVDHRTYPQ